MKPHPDGIGPKAASPRDVRQDSMSEVGPEGQRNGRAHERRERPCSAWIQERDRPARAGGGTPERPRGMAPARSSFCNEQRSTRGSRLAEGSRSANHRRPAPATGTVVPLWHRVGVSTATTSRTRTPRYEAFRGSARGDQERPGTRRRSSRGSAGAARRHPAAGRGGGADRVQDLLDGQPIVESRCFAHRRRAGPHGVDQGLREVHEGTR